MEVKRLAAIALVAGVASAPAVGLAACGKSEKQKEQEQRSTTKGGHIK